MNKVILVLIVQIVMTGVAFAGCEPVNFIEAENMGKSDLHKSLCRYQQLLKQEEKVTYNLQKSNKFYVNENQTVCLREIAKVEQIYVRKYGKIQECR